MAGSPKYRTTKYRPNLALNSVGGIDFSGGLGDIWSIFFIEAIFSLYGTLLFSSLSLRQGRRSTTPHHHHHHPRCRLCRHHRCRHCPRRRRSPVTLVPSLLQPLPSPSSSHATLVADSILLVIALALFVPHQPHCPHQRPFHPRTLRRCHHHPPHALVVRRRPPLWSCGCLVNALSPATARLCRSHRWLIVVRLLSP